MVKRAGPNHWITRDAAKITLALVAVLSPLAYQSAYAASPTVVIASAPAVDPNAALTYYGSPTSPVANSTRDPVIQELARALNYDVDQIFEYTRDNIELLPMFGVLKGGAGAALESYGTPFDQAQLMVDALREADAVKGKGYAPRYVLGRITLTAAQFTAWTGISDAAVATKYLANGGIPGIVTGTGASFSVQMLHTWVAANVGATSYLFDPSFKPSTARAGLAWQANTGYSSASLFTAAGGTTNATSVNNFNATAFRNTLNTYRTSLETFVQNSAAGKRAEAVTGATTINPHPTTENRRTSLPYVNSSDRTWTGEVPDGFRTSFTVRLNSSTYGTYFADIQGGKVTKFTYGFSGGNFVATGSSPFPAISTLYFDQCEDYLGNQPVASAIVFVDINHPYAANTGTYGDRTIFRKVARQQCSAGSFFVSNDWGYVGNAISSRLSPVAAAIRTDPTRATEFTFAPTLANVASQYSAWLDLAGKAQGSVFQMHDLVGIHTVDNVRTKLSRPPSADLFDLATYLSMSFEASVSATSNANTNASNIAAAYQAGIGLAIAEGAAPRQEVDAVHDMAAINLITQQDSRVTPASAYSTYFSSSSGWPGGNGTRKNLKNYPPDALISLDTYVTSEGYSILVPEQGALRQPPIVVTSSTVTGTASLWEGFNTFGNGGELNRSAFFAVHPTGAGLPPDKIAIGIYDRRRGSVVKAGLGVAQATGAGNSPIEKPVPPKAEGKDVIRAALNVDGRTGALTYAPDPDITDGIGQFPRSLQLKRIYDSRDQANYGLGAGWKTNWYQTVTYSNDGQAALGRAGAAGVASALVALQAIGDLVQTQDAKGLYAALQVASWFTDSTINNTALVNRGIDSESTFYRTASGLFSDGRPDGSRLVVSGNPVTGIVNRRLYIGVSADYTDSVGSVRHYQSQGDGIGYDLTSPALSALFARKTQYMKTWNFLDGVKINAEYNSSVAAPDVTYLQRVYNNLGSAIFAFNYDYGSATDFPKCNTPGGIVVYDPPRPARISYRTASAEVRYAMTAQLGYMLVGDPDTARCPTGSTTAPTTRQSYRSDLQGYSDSGAASWLYGYSSVPTMFGTIPNLGAIYKPTNVNPDVTIGFGGDNKVRSVVNLRSNSWIYRSSLFRSEVATPLQDAAAAPGAVTYFDRYAQPVTSIDPLQRVARTVFDGLGRVVQVTRPEGDLTISAYDARGNVLAETARAKPGSGLADRVTQTAYGEASTALTCTNFAICNKPFYVVDPRNSRTNYGWDSVTGEPTSIASGFDAATGATCQLSGGCPSTTFAYSGVSGFDPFNNASNGTLTLQSGKTVAIGSGSSTTTNYSYLLRDYSPAFYDGMTLNPVKKIEITGIVVDSGGLSLRSCFAYDKAGNVILATDPKAGLASCP